MHRYTEAQKQFVIKKIQGRSYKEMTQLFNKRFDLSITDGQMKSFLKNNKLCNGFGHGNPNIPCKRKYTNQHISFLKKNIRGRSYAGLSKHFNEQFGFSTTKTQFHSLLSRHNITNGRDTRFRPGVVPHNAGMKGQYPPGSEKGWFKKGHKLCVKFAIGDERIDNGYVQVKVSNRKDKPWKRWKHKHVVIWEKANGKVPKGYVVNFADGNNRNLALDNLLLISRKEHAVMNRFGLRSPHAGLTRAGVLVADLKMAIASRKRQIKKKSRTARSKQRKAV